MDETEDFTCLENLNKPRRTYLITYSQIDKSKFPTRESFAEACVQSFSQGKSTVTVVQYACCLENHIKGGEHYHLCLKLSGPKRWKSAKQHLLNVHKVSVHFQDKHDFYVAAYRYVTKEDKNVFHSPGHPALENISSPKTKQCIKEYRKRKSEAASELSSSSSGNPTPQKIAKRRLSNLDVADFLVANNVKSEKQLYATAQQRRKEGESDLAAFVMNRSSKQVSELIDTAWKLEDSQAIIDRESISRTERIHSASHSACENNCDGKWLECATEVLRNNNVHPYVFAAALRELIEKGRGKRRNIIITGPADSGKTFLLNPLSRVFTGTLSNPSSTKFGWIGADEAEIIFLNDFRWNPEQIKWSDFLLLLEGQTVHLPAPMNHYSKDICINSDVPIFATSIAEILFRNRSGDVNIMETEMMQVRWKVFQFTKQIPKEDQRNIPSCGACFSKLVLLGENMDKL